MDIYLAGLVQAYYVTPVTPAWEKDEDTFYADAAPPGVDIAHRLNTQPARLFHALTAAADWLAHKGATRTTA